MQNSVSFVSPIALCLTQCRLPAKKETGCQLQRSRYQTPICSLTPTQQTVLTALAVPALPIVAYSEYILGTTGCGLPPGPYGLYGAVEGISYLVIAGIIAISVYVKSTTGKGLPPGPANLLGAAEGAAYLLAIIGIVDAAYVAKLYGGLPSAVPTEGSRCF